MTKKDTPVSYRSAKKEDAPLIAQVLAMAFGEECSENYLGEDYLHVFEDIAKSEDSLYSFKNTIVAEVEGMPVGAVCGYDGAQSPALRRNTLSLIKEKTGREAHIEKETQEDEFYIDSLGILPQFRGKGLGSKLLLQMRDMAFSQGHPLVGLLVDENNTKAKELYEKLGFKQKESTSLLGHRMWHLQSEKK